MTAFKSNNKELGKKEYKKGAREQGKCICETFHGTGNKGVRETWQKTMEENKQGKYQGTSEKVCK